MPFPGYVKPEQYVIDAGVMYVGTSPAGMGASVGGLRFNPNAEWRQPEFDGMRAPIAGNDRKIGHAAVIEGDVLDFSRAAIGRYEPGSTSASSGSDVIITPIDADTFLTSGQYLRHVKWVGRLEDNRVAEVFFDWAFVEQWGLNTTDKNEGKIPVRIAARLAPDETNLAKCPYVIKYLDDTL